MGVAHGQHALGAVKLNLCRSSRHGNLCVCFHFAASRRQCRCTIAHCNDLAAVQLGYAVVGDFKDNVCVSGVGRGQSAVNIGIICAVDNQVHIAERNPLKRLADRDGAVCSKLAICGSDSDKCAAALDARNHAAVVHRGNGVVSYCPCPVDSICSSLLGGGVSFLFTFISSGSLSSCTHIDLYFIGQVYRCNRHPASRQR